MVKSGIISCILHLVIIFSLFSLTKEKIPEITNAGENIDVRMVSEVRGSLTDSLKGNSPEEKQNKEKRQESQKKPIEEVREETPQEDKTIEKKPEEKPGKKEKPEKNADIVGDKEKITEPIGKLQEEAEEALELTTDTAEATEENTDEKSATESSESEEPVSADRDENQGTEEGLHVADLIKMSDGTFMAKHQGVKGLTYGFVSNPEPSYPTQARRLGFKGDMIVQVIIEFDMNGKFSEMRFVGEEDRFGFRNEVKKVVENWRLTEIRYNSTPVKMRFYKSFRFEKQG